NLTADLTRNSNNADTSNSGTVPNGIPVTFGGTLGTPNPTSTTTTSGKATSVFTAGATPGTGTATATVDGFTVSVNLTIGPSLSTNDVSHPEGTGGTTTFTFTVSPSQPAGAGGVQFDIATADGTAKTSDNDYVAKSLTAQTIPQNSSTYTFDVVVNGDT